MTRDLGFLTDVWARWDSVWFLRIAEHGYASLEGTAAAFYPLYPASVGLLGRVFFGHYVLAGIAISLAASLAAFVLLYDLAETKLGAEGARRTVLYLAIFPMTLFLQAVYSESLFPAPDRGSVPPRRAQALRLHGPRRGPGPAHEAGRVRPPARARAHRLALTRPLARPGEPRHRPLALLRLPDLSLDRPRRPLRIRPRAGASGPALSYAGPLGGIWDGLRAGWAGVRQLVSGSHTTTYWPAVDGTDPMRVAAVNLEGLAFLVLFLV